MHKVEFFYNELHKLKQESRERDALLDEYKLKDLHITNLNKEVSDLKKLIDNKDKLLHD